MIELESENFRIDSSGWEQFTSKNGVIIYLRNSDGDVWEYVGYERWACGGRGMKKKLVGQQLFTWNAAIRETQKVSKRMPTNKEWNILVNGYGALPKGVRLEEGSPPCGYRCDFSYNVFRKVSESVHLWSSSLVSSCNELAHMRELTFSLCGASFFDLYKGLGAGLSVRCLKN